MKANMMRAPLIKSAVVLLVFVLLAYLTSASPEGSVLNSVGLIIIGAFRFVQWLIAMAIGLTFSIACLIGIFLFAAYLVNKETAASLYEGLKISVVAFCQPIFARFGVQCREAQCAPTAPPAQAEGQLKEDLHALIAGEVNKVTVSQQALNEQFAALSSKIVALEEKSTNFAAAGQLDAIASEIAASGKVLGTVQEKVVTLEGKIGDTVEKLAAITPEKMLGDIPTRLEKLEQGGDEQPAFDPAPLTASIETLQKEMEELKKKSPAGGKAKKKA